MGDMETRISGLQVAQGRTDEQMKTVFRRLDAQDSLIETVNELAISVSRLTDGQSRIESGLSSMRRDVDELRQKPVRAVRGIGKTAITAFVTGIVSYIIGKFTA